MTDPGTIIVKLESLAQELNELSLGLADTARKLEPIARDYREFIDDFEVAVAERCEQEDKRLPSEKLREAMARKSMPQDLRGQYGVLSAKRDRLQRRLKDIETEVDIWRSVLSAEKTMAGV